MIWGLIVEDGPSKFSFIQSLGFENLEAVDSSVSSDMAYQKWVGKDYYNPFIKDFIELHKPHEGNLTKTKVFIPREYHNIIAGNFSDDFGDLANFFETANLKLVSSK